MSTRAASWLAWSLAGLSLAAFIADVVLYVLARSAHDAHSTWGTAGAADVRFVVLNVPFLTFPIVGSLIASRRPRSPIGWIWAVGILAIISDMSSQYTAYGIARPGSVPFLATIFALTQWTWVLPVGLLGIYLLLLFPDGRLPSRRWRPLAWLSGAVIVLLGVANVLAPGPLTDLGGGATRSGLREPLGWWMQG